MVLSLTLAVVALGMVVVVVRDLVRTVRRLVDQVRATTERLVPLTQELQGELAVTSAEISGLTEHVAQVQQERSRRPTRRKPKQRR